MNLELAAPLLSAAYTEVCMQTNLGFVRFGIFNLGEKKNFNLLPLLKMENDIFVIWI